jgi:hypothetical protein
LPARQFTAREAGKPTRPKSEAIIAPFGGLVKALGESNVKGARAVRAPLTFPRFAARIAVNEPGETLAGYAAIALLADGCPSERDAMLREGCGSVGDTLAAAWSLPCLNTLSCAGRN